MAEKSFQQQDWSRGLSESELNGGQGYFSKSYAVDIHSVPGVLRAALQPAKETASVVVDFCKFAIDASKGTISTVQQSFWFGDAGNIYRRIINASGVVSWGSVYHNRNDAINGAWEFNNYIYWSHGTTVNRMPLDSAILAGAWATGSVEASWGQLNNTEYHPAVVIGTYALVGNGTTIASVDDTGTITANGIPDVSIAHLPASYEIVSLHKYDIDVLAGTKNKGGVTGTKLLRWDLASPAFTQDIDVPESSVNSFLTTNNRTFLQAGVKGKIYEYNGVSVSPYKTIPNNENQVSGYATTYPQSSANFEGIGYFGVSNTGDPSTDSLPIPGLYALGRKNEKYPISLSHQYGSSNTDRDTRIGAVVSGLYSNLNIPYLVFSWRDSTAPSYGIDAIHNTSAQRSGAYIETQSVGGNRFLQKTFGNYAIGYKSKPAGTNISLSYYSNFSTSTGSINLQDRSEYNTMTSNDKIEAGAMKFKITLTASGGNTPEVEDLFVNWNEKSII